MALTFTVAQARRPRSKSFSKTLLREDLLKEARMARLIYSAITSLDGYTADADGRFEGGADPC
jgi:hypothetical protein